MVNLWGDEEQTFGVQPMTPSQADQQTLTINDSAVASDIQLQDAASVALNGTSLTPQDVAAVQSAIERIGPMIAAEGLSGSEFIEELKSRIPLPPGFDDRYLTQLAEREEVKQRDLQDMMNMTPDGQSLTATQATGVGAGLGAGIFGVGNAFASNQTESEQQANSPERQSPFAWLDSILAPIMAFLNFERDGISPLAQGQNISLADLGNLNPNVAGQQRDGLGISV